MRYLDVAMVKESIISLLLSLIGLVLMGKVLETHTTDSFAKYIPHIFIVNSMVTFKNNIELNYADQMSTSTKVERSTASIENRRPNYGPSFLEYMVSNGSKTFVNSMGLSLLIGIFASYRYILLMVRGGVKDNVFNMVTIVFISVFTGVCSSIISILSVILCIYISIYLAIDPDNVILPLIASLEDYVSTISLFYFSKQLFLIGKEHFVSASLVLSSILSYFRSGDSSIFITNASLLLVVSVAVLLLYFRRSATNKICSTSSLIATFVIAAFSGYLMQYFNDSYSLYLGILTPVFNGLTGSVILIYTSKLTTYNKHREVTASPKTTKVFITLITISLIISVVSLSIMKLLFDSLSATLFVLFTVLFLVQTVVLYVSTNVVQSVLLRFNCDLDFYLVPIINVLGDLLGTLVFSTGIIGCNKYL